MSRYGMGAVRHGGSPWCDEWQIWVNGAPVAGAEAMNGYVAVTRCWQPGDRVEVRLAMPVQSVWAHPAVRQLQVPGEDARLPTR